MSLKAHPWSSVQAELDLRNCSCSVCHPGMGAGLLHKTAFGFQGSIKLLWWKNFDFLFFFSLVWVVNLVRVFKVPWSKNFLFWHYWLFCTRMKIRGSYEPRETISWFPDICFYVYIICLSGTWWVTFFAVLSTFCIQISFRVHIISREKVLKTFAFFSFIFSAAWHSHQGFSLRQRFS